MSSCIVYLDNFQGQYYPGSNIVGRVVCSFNSSKNVRGIRLKLRGKEHNYWTKTESYYDDEEKRSRTRTVDYSGDNKFLSIESTLIGPGDISPGRHEYPFSFNLPMNVPGTYYGKYGWVKFSIKATVDRPYKSDYEDEKEFNVVAPVDFNKIRDTLQLDPVAYSDDKTLCCCCCASGPITMNVHLEREAYIQGETAKVKVEITNMADENVEMVKVELGMTVKAIVTIPSHDSKQDYELLAMGSDTGVGAHGERTYEFELEIPKSTVVPNFNLCTLFSQWSTLKVTAALPSCHSDMTISTEIVMGHIPIGHECFQHADILQTANVMPPYLPPQLNQFPLGGVPYPPDIQPYPLNPPNTVYPPSSNPPPYASVTPSPSPMHAPPAGCPIGFSLSQSTTSTSAAFSSVPSGAFPPAPHPNFSPYPPATGPSAPPKDDGASAPSKAQLAERNDGDFVVVGDKNPLIAPPSYNEAVPYPPK